MPPGRPRLPPEIKQEHILKSRRAYEERNADKRREDARDGLPLQTISLPMTSTEAESPQHHDDIGGGNARRKFESSMLLPSCNNERAEEEQLRRKHKAIALAQQKHGDSSGRKGKRLTEVPQETHRLPKAKRLPVSPQEQPRAVLPSHRRADSPCPRRLTDIARHDSDSDDSDESDSCDAGRVRVSEAPIFERRAISQVRKCLHCYEEGCPGCACMCEASTVWIPHEGGHFYPTCQKCGGHDCPGCACVCPKATAFVEHGGHAR
ncbi:hypothetical protein C8R45DRAFT_1115162 [Mycena sanguinolenta]|nr:hypothetical protein C8R45DRAFT_1115162 [Mycena sanguinolenta]